jgi:ribose transport system permease protein
MPIDCIATTPDYQLVVGNVLKQFPQLNAVPVEIPESYYWPTFLKLDNLRNVANQIVVIAVIAVGMTMVIITGGIDLSVGSLVALSAVSAATLIVQFGGTQASTAGLIAASLAAILLCGAVGAFSGVMITRFTIPPFIATLAVMLVARGVAFIITRGESVYQLPDAFTWLGRGTSLLAIPNAVILMVLIYAASHVLMTRSTLGRYIYAVGGNRQAAKLSGIQTARVRLAVYVVSGIMAGLGGVILGSQLKAGGPQYGDMYELYAIAAVVVGGTSLSGGEGRVLDTLVGAFIIAVIQNGMNLTNVESYTQMVVLGLVILGAVLLDSTKKFGWRGVINPQ